MAELERTDQDPPVTQHTTVGRILNEDQDGRSFHAGETRLQILFPDNPPLLILILTLGGVFVAEILAMIMVNRIISLPIWQQTMLDALLITLMVTPLLYYGSFRPLLKHIQQRRLVEKKLYRLNEELEARIEKRTGELFQAWQNAEARTQEIEALLTATRAVLERKDFQETAATIFQASKEITGATAGYIALHQGEYNQPVYLDPGEFFCTVDPDLPMPVRGLRAETYRTGKTVFDNHFPASQYQQLLPEGHAQLESVLFAPLKIEQDVVGLIGLANKPGGFDQQDAHMASAFGEIASIALINSQNQEELRRSRDDLELRVQERTVQLQQANESLHSEILERKRIETELRASEERFRQLAENIEKIFWMLDPDANEILYISPAYEEIWGRTCQSLYEQPESFLDTIFPEDKPRVVSALHRVREGLNHEFRILKTDGSIRWVHNRAFPIRNTDGVVYRIAGIARDITDEKHAQAALINSEKLALAGKLAASLAHEINNPLQSVIGCIDLAQEALDEGQEVSKFLGVASQALQRTTDVLAELRNLQKPYVPKERELEDVRPLLEGVLLLTQKQCETRNIQVQWTAEENLPKVYIYPDMIRQVFLNLILNAIEAMPNGGSLWVVLEPTEDPDGLRLQFKDSGDGIPPEFIGQVFDPFFSTKIDGMGLGLFNSREIVHQHNGWIEVDSQVHQGTRFSMWLPA